MRYHFAPTRMTTITVITEQKTANVGEDEEKLKPLGMDAGGVKRCSLRTKQSGGSSKSYPRHQIPPLATFQEH